MGKYIDDELKRNVTLAYYTAISQPQKTWKTFMIFFGQDKQQVK